MESAFLLSILGTVASVAGLAAAFTQSVRLRQLKRRTNYDVWLSIHIVLSIMSKLEKSPSRNEDPGVSQVYGRAADLYRHLLKQAALDEKRFTEDTILKWRAAGKIETDWQASQARHFLSTKEINLYGGPKNAADA